MQNGTVFPLSPGIRTTALALAVDAVTAEVVTALRNTGIRPLLSRDRRSPGGCTKTALRAHTEIPTCSIPRSYPAGGECAPGARIPPARLPEPGTCGFAGVAASFGQRLRRSSSLSGRCLRFPRRSLGRACCEDGDAARGWHRLEVLGMPGWVLHIALHAAQHGVDSERPLTDLGRAIRNVDEQVWREATELARRVDALPAFATGLRLDDPGRQEAGGASAPPRGSPAAGRAARRPEARVAITLERLASEGSLRARARLLLGALFPSPGYMRKWATGRGWPWAGAGPPGRLGLWLAYIWRLIWILGRLPRAVATVRLARRGQGSAASCSRRGPHPRHRAARRQSPTATSPCIAPLEGQVRSDPASQLPSSARSARLRAGALRCPHAGSASAIPCGAQPDRRARRRRRPRP